MAYQPLDRAKDDETMHRHKALADPMAGRWGRLLLLIHSVSPNGLARYLLGKTFILHGALSLGSHLGKDHLRSWGWGWCLPLLLKASSIWLPHYSPLLTCVHLCKRWRKRLEKEGRTKMNWQKDKRMERKKLRWREKASNRQASVVGSKPPQKA